MHTPRCPRCHKDSPANNPCGCDLEGFIPEATLSKQEFRDYCESPDGLEHQVRFNIAIPFHDLAYNEEGIITLNRVIDEFVDGGHLLMDLHYEAIRLDKVAGVIIQVTADASEFFSDED